MTTLTSNSFCERCGTRTVTEEAATPLGGLVGRVRSLAGRPAETTSDNLSLCLGCRGYVCAGCLNDRAGLCIDCAPPVAVDAGAWPAVERALPLAAADAVVDIEPAPELNPAPVAEVEPEPELAPVPFAQVEPELAPVAEIEVPVFQAPPVPEWVDLSPPPPPMAVSPAGPVPPRPDSPRPVLPANFVLPSPPSPPPAVDFAPPPSAHAATPAITDDRTVDGADAQAGEHVQADQAVLPDVEPHPAPPLATADHGVPAIPGEVQPSISHVIIEPEASMPAVDPRAELASRLMETAPMSPAASRLAAMRALARAGRAGTPSVPMLEPAAPSSPQLGTPPTRAMPPGARACHHCDLPISTRAGFCRRCGSPQPRAA